MCTCVCKCVYVCMYVCVNSCVCVRERKRVRERLRVFLLQINNRHQKANPLAFVLVVEETEGVSDSLLMQECSHHHHHHHCRRRFSFVFICFQKFSAFYFILSSHFVISCCQPSIRTYTAFFTAFVSDNSIELQIKVFVKSTFKQPIIIQVQYWPFK